MATKNIIFLSLCCYMILINFGCSRGDALDNDDTVIQESQVEETEICCCCDGKGESTFANNGDSYYGTHIETCACCDGDGKQTKEQSEDSKKNSLFCQ